MNSIRAHKLLYVLVGWLILLIIATIIFFIMQAGYHDGQEVVEIDPTSQVEILRTTDNPANSELPPLPGPDYIGWEGLYGWHSAQWLTSVKRMLNLYAYENNIDLWRISVYKDGFGSTEDRERLITIDKIHLMLNRDERELYIEVTADIRHTMFRIYDAAGSMLWEREMVLSDYIMEYVASNPPAATDYVVVFHGQSIDANGHTAWSLELTNSEAASAEFVLAPGFAPPSPADGSVITVSIAIDPVTGQRAIYRYATKNF